MSSLDLRKVGTLQDIADVPYPEPPDDFDERHRKVFDRIVKTRAAVQWRTASMSRWQWNSPASAATSRMSASS